MKTLEESRQTIDSIDYQIMQLFEQRMEAVEEVIQYKIAHQIPILNTNRELEVLQKNLAYLKQDKWKPYGRLFFQEMMRISRQYQSDSTKAQEERLVGQGPDEKVQASDWKIGFQGTRGSFSEEALLQYFEGRAYRSMAYEHFSDLVKAVSEGLIDYGVLPIENSSTGSIHEVYDLLKAYDVFIVGETQLKINQNLLGLKGSRIEDIKTVYSHTQGFKQSSSYLAEHSEWLLLPYHNTAMSAKFVADQQDMTKAAIGSLRAAETYGLTILEKDIHDQGENTTKFIILSKKQEIHADNHKTSLLFTIKNEPGALGKVLDYFRKAEINMIKLESRPIPNNPWQYCFYIDIESGGPQIGAIIENIKGQCDYFKLLGTYKVR